MMRLASWSPDFIINLGMKLWPQTQSLEGFWFDASYWKYCRHDTPKQAEIHRLAAAIWNAQQLHGIFASAQTKQVKWEEMKERDPRLAEERLSEAALVYSLLHD